MSFSGCHSGYHNNFTIQDGIQTYHSGIPKYIQAGKHQFVENTVVKMWINQMLVGW